MNGLFSIVSLTYDPTCRMNSLQTHGTHDFHTYAYVKIFWQTLGMTVDDVCVEKC